jgi:hypothetical protein
MHKTSRGNDSKWESVRRTNAEPDENNEVKHVRNSKGIKEKPNSLPLVLLIKTRLRCLGEL